MHSAPHRLQQDLLGGMEAAARRKRPGTRKVSEPRRTGFAKALALVVEGGRRARQAPQQAPHAQAQASGAAEGWLFPPELLAAARPAGKRKRPAARTH